RDPAERAGGRFQICQDRSGSAASSRAEASREASGKINGMQPCYSRAVSLEWSMKKDKDGYGALLLSALKTGGLGVFEIAEREDGFIAASNWPPRYFAEHSAWSKRERQAMQAVKGRVLDIGC